MTQSKHKVLVAYFSATGTTARVAEKIAAATDGTLCPIVPAERYTDADLDWHDRRSRSSLEMNDPTSRPAIRESDMQVNEYDEIFIGYPIWWDLAPHAINTFVEHNDLKGKRLIPFATSGGSGIAHSAAMLKKEYPELNWETGQLINRADERTIHAWIERQAIGR